jgi:hypothetical protein
VQERSSGDLVARRRAILERLGTTLEDLSERARTSSLVGPEWEAWEQLQDIDFLLGDHEG